MRNYLRLAAMVATSVVLMYGITYLASYEIADHAFFSETRLFVSLLMGVTMVVVMLGYMWGMYRNRRLNVAVIALAVVAFGGLVLLLRSQATIDDLDYMEAMIPHHSIAILTSERADIVDPRVRHLADEIIAAQEREIGEMKALIADLRGGPSATAEIDSQ